MNKANDSFRSIRSFLIFLLIIVINIPLFPQNRGIYSFASPEAKKLQFGSPMSAGGSNQVGLSSVGGISFDQKAIPGYGLTINGLTINYNAQNPDGQRLVLNINGNPVSAGIYDWMLLPIAAYANSPYYACFTYFGELTDRNMEETILLNNGRILNYHPDLFNNLLGLRIADMDLLMMYDFTIVLPKANRNFILGAGENVPDTVANAAGFNNFLLHVNQTGTTLQQTFRSYVITDYMQNLLFSISNGQLNISGEPFYYCWRYNYDNLSFNQQQVESNIISAYSIALNKALAINPSFDARDLYIDSLLSAATRYEGKYNIYSAGTFVDLLKLDKTGNVRRNFLEMYYTNDLYNMLISVEVNMVAYGIEYLKQYSEAISRPDLIQQANPHVWNATRMLMKYAAFFRYVKEEFPAQWTGFIDQVKNLKSQPPAITPTVMYPTGNTVIGNVIENYFNANMPAVDAGDNILIGACEKNITLNATGSGVYLTWQWTPNDGSLSDINIPNPVIKNPNPGETTYTVTVTDIRGNTKSDNKIVTVAGAPAVSAPADISITENLFPYTLNTYSTGTGLAFSWLPDNGSLNNIHTQSPQIIVPKGGKTEYIVRVTDTFGCNAADTVAVFVDPALSASNATDDYDLKIYPNPFIDFLRIDKAGNISRIEIYDEAGRLIISRENASNSIILRTNDLSPGKYLAYIFMKNKKVYGRRIIKSGR